MQQKKSSNDAFSEAEKQAIREACYLENGDWSYRRFLELLNAAIAQKTKQK